MTIERTIAWFKERPAVLIGSVALVAISSTMTIVDGAKRLFEFYAVTIGYNNELDRKLNALRVEVDIGYLNGILGPPAVINERTIRSTHVPSITGKSIEKRLEFKEYFYINRD